MIDERTDGGSNCVVETFVEIRNEAADETALRVFTALRILKYRPPTNDPDELYHLSKGPRREGFEERIPSGIGGG